VAAVLQVGTIYTGNISADTGVAVVVPADADAVTIDVAGNDTAGPALIDNASFAGASAGIDFTIIGTSFWSPPNEPECASLLLLASDAEWPGAGSKTLYLGVNAPGEGICYTITFWKNVDQVDPIVDVKTKHDAPDEELVGMTADDMAVRNYDFYNSDPGILDGLDDNDQTVLRAGPDVFNNCLQGVTSKLGASTLSPGAIWDWVLYGLRGATASPTAPTITSAGTAGVIRHGETGVAVTGTNLGASNANRNWFLRQGSVEVPQTETGTGTSTAATLTITVLQTGSDIKFGAAQLVCVRDDDEEATFNVTVLPPTGYDYVDITTPAADPSERLSSDNGDLASGDQAWYELQTGLSVGPDGRITWDVGATPVAFDYTIWDASDATWGAGGTISPAAGGEEIEAAGAIVLGGIEVVAAGAAGRTAAGTIELGGIEVAAEGAAGRSAAGAIILGGIEVAGQVALEIEGDGAITLGAIGVSAAVELERYGEADIQLPAIVVAGAGSAGKSAEAEITLGPIAVAGAVSIGRDTAAAIQLGAVQVAAAGDVARDATGDITLGPVAVAGAGTVGREATADITLGSIKVAGSGTGQAIYSGEGHITLGAIEVAAAGDVGRLAAGAITLGRIGVAGAAVVGREAQAEITLGAVSVAGAAVVGRHAVAEIMLGAVQVAGAGTTEGMDVGTGVIALGAVAVSGAAEVGRSAAGQITLGGIQVAGAVEAGRIGVGSITLGGIRVIGLGDGVTPPTAAQLYPIYMDRSMAAPWRSGSMRVWPS